MVDYTLCYSQEDGKLHIGLGCSEHEEKFVGTITEETIEAEWYTGNGSVLTLENCAFATSADIALAVPNGTTVAFRGKNSVKVITDREDANVAVLYSSGDLSIQGGDGDSLEIIAETEHALWSRAVCARLGDMDVRGGEITALGGKGWKNCGLYAGGHLWVDMGDKGVITIYSGKVTATRCISGEYLPDRMHIAAGSTVTNAKEYTGGDSFWKGPSLKPIEEGVPIVVTVKGL